MLFPSVYERGLLFDYLKPSKLLSFLQMSIDEAIGRALMKDYTFNAYYRHKYTNRKLNLHKLRFYTKFLNFSRDQMRRRPTVLNSILHMISRWVYVLTNFWRYLYSTFVFPLIIIKRGRISFKSFLRLISQKEVLPERLP